MARTYTPEQRARALGLYREGLPASEVARRTSIPRGTITRWASEGGVESARAEKTARATEAAKLSWERRRVQLADEEGAVAAGLLDRMRDATPLDTFNLARAHGILVDKAEGLLAGRATARLDVPPHVTPAEARLELEQLSRTLAARRDGHDGASRDRMDGEIDRMLGEMAGRS